MGAKGKATLLILNEKKSLNTQAIRDAWSGATVETIPAEQKLRGAAPRAGVSMVMEPDLKHVVTHIYN